MYESSTKETSECASILLAHEDLGHLRRPIVGIYKPSSIMKNPHYYMKVTKQETLYYEDHGATLKHKCGKRIVALYLFISFFGPFFIWPFSPFFIWDNALLNDDHQTSIYLQLNDYNLILRTKHDSI